MPGLNLASPKATERDSVEDCVAMVESPKSPRSPGHGALAAVIAAVFWFALVLQASLTRALVESQGGGAARAIWVYLGYFTILSNLIAALALVLPVLSPRSAAGRFFARPGSITAIAVYMLLVGIAYNLLLRGVWNPQGWQLVADNLLHCSNPLLFAIYWWFAGRSRELSYAAMGVWALYPIGYLVYAVARGLSGDFYAYPFIDVAQLGFARVMLNAFAVALGFFALAASLIALGRRYSP